MTTQLIWTGFEYEAADYSNSDEPTWPVQDESGRWHREQFPGQRVSYHQQTVWFGFQARELIADDLDALDFEELDSDIYVTTGRGVFKSL